MKYLGLCVLWLCSWLVNAAPADFSAAKKLAQRIYADETSEFYCGCPLRWVGGKGQLDLTQCGYKVRKNGPRAQRVEWEHVVPAHRFGSPLACWKQGGRERCSDQDRQFRQMEGDLYNLKPANGEVNGDRANFSFAELPAVAPQHGACPVKIDFSRQLAEPRAEIRGDIARIYFYMADRYQLQLSATEQALFLRWHQADPVDDRELLLAQRTAQLMGHQNEFVTGRKIWYQGYLVQKGTPVPAMKTSEQTTSGKKWPVNQPEPGAPAVRGNKNSKKYHLPHCPGFSQIKIQNGVDFSTEQQAQQAGYTRAGNCRD